MPLFLVAPGEGRHPNLPDGRVGGDDEPCVARLFEHQVEDAVLQLHLEAFLVGQRQNRTAGGLERSIALDAEFLLGESRHGVSGERSCGYFADV